MLDQDLWSVVSVLVIFLVPLNLVNTHCDGDLQFTKCFHSHSLRAVSVLAAGDGSSQGEFYFLG